MENTSNKPAENNLPAQHVNNTGLPIMYTGASSQATLSERERKALSARFAEDEYEIREDGIVYVPQALIRMRLNEVIGASEWAILLERTWEEPVNEKKVKVYFDGMLYIRGCFIARSTGEGSYFKNNQNTSSASALESAKSDCLSRCVKDIGIGLEIYLPSFKRQWVSENGLKVYVKDGSDKRVVWRSKFVEPLEGEIGEVPTTPTVPPKQKTPFNPELSKEWTKKLADSKTLAELVELYTSNKEAVDGWPKLKDAFMKRREQVTNPQAA